MYWLLLCLFVVLSLFTRDFSSRIISLLMFVAKLAEAASSALMYLQQHKDAGQR